MVAGVVSNLAAVCLISFPLQCSAIIYLRFITTPPVYQGTGKGTFHHGIAYWGGGGFTGVGRGATINFYKYSSTNTTQISWVRTVNVS